MGRFSADLVMRFTIYRRNIMILIATEGMDDIVPARRIRLPRQRRSHAGSPRVGTAELTMSGRPFYPSGSCASTICHKGDSERARSQLLTPGQ